MVGVEQLYWTGGEIHYRRNHTKHYSEVEILKQKRGRDDAEIFRSLTITNNQLIVNDI